MKRFGCLADVARHVHTQNRTGRGRPWSIAGLIQLLKGWPKPPRRITTGMRLELYYALEALGVASDNILREGARSTRLYAEVASVR